MDASQNPTPAIPSATGARHSQAEAPASVPTRAEIAEWEAEAQQFLSDLERRLREMTIQIERKLNDGEVVANEPIVVAAELFAERNVVQPAANGDNRISALKAQLAMKLNNLQEQTADGGDDTADTRRRV